ncbi:hypothetical protein WME75_04595 [Sorangium sp. So ce1014]|uniref:hypothetical protein n=1 Tax=Sorangium sp. So ce1014 TaxID=3133326 RepID=UPI003F627A98
MKSKTLLLGSLAAGIMSAGCGVSYDETVDGEIGSVHQAFVSRTWAYAWAQQATGSFTANSSYARNSSGDVSGEGVDNTVTQLGTGRYRVQFPGIGASSGGNVQVTAYGSGAERCKVDHWNSSGGGVNVYVNCFTAGGAAINTRFSVAYVRKSGTGSSDEAYVWANDPTAAAYTPDLTHQFNSSGVNNTIVRQGVGRYAVTLPGQTAVGGTVEVTAYGPDSDHCKVAGWGQSGDDTAVNVRCFDSAGALADGRFTLNFARSAPPNGGLSYSYAWAHDTAAASYTPSLAYQKGFISGDAGDVEADITAGRTSAGRYSVNLPGMSATGSNVQVTAYGTGSEYCKVVGWSGDGSETQASVACFDEGGTSADTRFVLVYTGDKYIIQ